MFAIILTIGSGFYATARLASVLIAALALSFLWSRASVRWLDVRSKRVVPQVQVGDTLEEEITVANRSFLPVPWVLVEDAGTLPGQALGRVLGMGGSTNRTWKAATECEQRGLFDLGPIQVVSSDPLGIFTARRTYGEAQRILVYPATLPLPGFVISTAERTGESLDLRSTSSQTPNVTAVRKYEIGDSMNRIHWKSTARHGHLMVKEFEIEQQGGVWILLDMQKDVQTGNAPHNTEEYGVTAAASIAHTMMNQDKQVGLALAGDEDHVLFPDRTPEYRVRLLETLASVKAEGGASLPVVLSRIERFLGPSSSVVAISPSAEDLRTVSSYLVGRGISSAIVALDAESFGPDGDFDGINNGDGTGDTRPLTQNLITAGVAAYRVRRGDDLTTALSMKSAGTLAAR